MILLPPASGACPACGLVHDSDTPHNAQSMYYMMRFFSLRGRYPTWADAIAHCSDGVRRFWEEHLRRLGGWTQPPPGVDVIADPMHDSIHQPINIGDVISVSDGDPETDGDDDEGREAAGSDQ